MAFQRDLVREAISVRPLVVLGEASFALSLSHQPVSKVLVVHHAAFGHRPNHVVALFCWGPVIAISLALWQWVGKPARAWSRKGVSSGQTAAQTPAV